MVLWTFDGHGDAHPSADAERSNAALEILILHLVQQGDKHERLGREGEAADLHVDTFEGATRKVA